MSEPIQKFVLGKKNKENALKALLGLFNNKNIIIFLNKIKWEKIPKKRIIPQIDIFYTV